MTEKDSEIMYGKGLDIGKQLGRRWERDKILHKQVIAEENYKQILLENRKLKKENNIYLKESDATIEQFKKEISRLKAEKTICSECETNETMHWVCWNCMIKSCDATRLNECQTIIEKIEKFHQDNTEGIYNGVQVVRITEKKWNRFEKELKKESK